MLEVGYQRQRALILALLASLLFWNLPFGGLILYPFKLMATWLHEMSHGLTMLLTGAGFSHLEIYDDTSGLAQARHGVGTVGKAIIHSAGYMGTGLFGALFLILGQTRPRARSILALIGLTLLVSGVLWIRNEFGEHMAYAGAAACVSMAVVPSQRLAILVVNFIAVQACTNSLLDIRVLFRPQMVINGKSVGHSDAHNMADATFGNHTLWAVLWLLWSAACLFVALRVIRRLHTETEERNVHARAREQALRASHKPP